MCKIQKLFIFFIAIFSICLVLSGCNSSNDKKNNSDPVGQALLKSSHDTSSPLNSHPIDNP